MEENDKSNKKIFIKLWCLYEGEYITFQKCAIYFLLTILIEAPLKVHIEAQVKYITIKAWGYITNTP